MDSIYKYSFDKHGELKEGSLVPHKTVLNVECRIINYDYNFDDDQQTVQCINGILETANFSCQIEAPVEEKAFSCKLENGQAQRRSNWNFEEYYLEVSCNEGYKLNLILPDKPYCKCSKTGDLLCNYGGQTPKCLSEDCAIPEVIDPRLTIYDLSNGYKVSLSRGIKVKHGKTVYFKCTQSSRERFKPYDTPFTCMNGKWLEDATHGEWIKTGSSYFPKCIKLNCEIPETYDSQLSIYVIRNGATTSLSGGMLVDHDEYVYFNCSNTATDSFELDGTGLKCVKGKWLKVATHEEWLNFKSSNFPQCRKAICLPQCQNGGKCVRYDTCECQPQSTGRRCETVECDKECHENGGTCIAPGKCGLCPDGRSGNNCQDFKCDLECHENGGTCIAPGKCGLCPEGRSGNNCQDQGCPRPVNVPQIKRPKDIYNIGETIRSAHFVCPTGHVLMPWKGISCSSEGWTETAECKPLIKYEIQLKTGSQPDAGTHVIYVNLHGEKFSTQKINVRYSGDKLYESSQRRADITPIRYITVGRDSVSFSDDLQVDFVSIFVDFEDGRTTTDDQFYYFDAEPDLWINDKDDRRITLSENCTIPEKNEHDSGLTIYVPIDGSDVGLSRGMKVKHGDSINFKCSYSETDHLELDYTRLECMKGKWLKVATNEEWLKLNSSDFPKCRTAICIPLCENGGKCVRDDTCECRPQSTGKRCEKVECDRECDKNGGKCIAPGKCGQCPHGKSGTNCQDQGCPRPGNVPIIKDPKENYNIGETIDSAHFVCPPNDELMPRNGMSCLARGWTDTAECIPKIKYVIQIQTGPDTFAGTGDKVYVNLHGDKYSTGPLNVRGSYAQDSLDKDNIWSVDVTPIRSITVSKDSSWPSNELQVNYVSIFVEKDDHYNVFDVNNNWITDQTGKEIELSHHPQQCVHTFQRIDDLYPSDKQYNNAFNLGRGSNISLRTCKQMCVLFKEKHCNGVYLYESGKMNDCWGFVDTSYPYFIRKTNTNFYRRSCL